MESTTRFGDDSMNEGDGKMNEMSDNVKGIKEIRKVSRSEIKVVFQDKKSTNDFYLARLPPDWTLVIDFLKDNLDSDLPITGIHRCMKRKVVNGTKTEDWIPANTVKLTFRGQHLPDEVTFGFSKRKVKPHIPDIIQCFRCLRFGHTHKFCRQNGQTCRHCIERHECGPGKRCQQVTKCFHCHSDKYMMHHLKTVLNFWGINLSKKRWFSRI